MAVSVFRASSAPTLTGVKPGKPAAFVSVVWQAFTGAAFGETLAGVRTVVCTRA